MITRDVNNKKKEIFKYLFILPGIRLAPVKQKSGSRLK